MSSEQVSQKQASKARRGLLGRFRRDSDGATAIEFAILAMPFCLLVFAILESCISFAGQQVMTNISDDIARQVRTGQLRNLTQATLRQKICTELEIIVTANCPGLDVDLRQFATFEDAAAAAPLKMSGGDIDTSQFAVSPGGAMTRNMLRVIYRWPIMTDLLRLQMSTLSGGKTLHFATTTWRNEPFDD